jgi:tetratricopeptide (TPR) repeat protein
MDSLTKPLERVVEAIEHFVRTPSLKCLYVTTSQMLRMSVLQHLAAAELFDFNKTPFFVLEAATEPGDDGWATRTDELRDDWELLSEEAPAGAMDPLWPEQQAKTALARFGMELGRASSALNPPATGLTIVLAPVWVSDAKPWCTALSTLLWERGLPRVRFVIVETDTTHGLELLEDHRAHLEHIDARVNDKAIADEARARLEAMKSAPAGASGARLAGAAGPDIAPPPRKNQPAPLTPAQAAEKAKELGIPAAYLQPDVMQRLNLMLMSAALAARDKNLPEAVRHQREARDFCTAQGMHRESVVNELILGSYLLQGGSTDKALELYREARRRAEQHKLPEQTVQSQMAVAACLFILKRLDEAATAYAEAGNLGIEQKSVPLAIESFRMCGQIAASRGHLEQAGSAFRRALAAAESAPDVAGASSAPEAARQLAALCRKHGMTAQADSLEAQATAMEAAAVQPPAPPASPSASPPSES